MQKLSLIKWPLLVAIFISAPMALACKMNMARFDDQAKGLLIATEKLDASKVLSVQATEQVVGGGVNGDCPEVLIFEHLIQVTSGSHVCSYTTKLKHVMNKHQDVFHVMKKNCR
jgi:hypothetical protein